MIEIISIILVIGMCVLLGIRERKNKPMKKRTITMGGSGYESIEGGGFKIIKHYTKDDIEDAFNESRLTHPMVGFKHDDFENYLKWKEKQGQ